MLVALALGLLAVAEAGADRPPDGGGPAPHLGRQVPCLDDEARRGIEDMLAQRLSELQAQGLVPTPSVAPGTLQWPLAPASAPGASSSVSSRLGSTGPGSLICPDGTGTKPKRR